MKEAEAPVSRADIRVPPTVPPTRRAGWSLALLGQSTLYLDSIYLIGSNVVAAAFGFLFWTSASRLYEPRAVGLAAATVSVIALLGLLSGMGLDYAIVRFVPQTADARGIVASSVTIGAAASIMLSLAFVAGFGVWAPALLPLRGSVIFVVSIVVATMCTTLVNLFAGVFLARKRPALVFWQAAVLGGAKVLGVVGLAMASRAAVGLIGAWALALATAVAGSIVSFFPRVEQGWRPLRPMIRREAINDMTHFAFANYVALVLWGAPTFLLPLLVVNLVGPEATAYFYVAANVASLLAMIPMGVSLSLFAHGSHDEQDLVRHTLGSARFILLLLVPAILAVWLIGDKLLLLFGRAYSEHATRLLQVLALSALPMAVNFLLFSVRRVQLRMAGVVGSTVWVLAVTLGLSAVLLPRMGLLGAGIASLAAQTSMAAVILGRYAFSRG